MPVNFHAMPIEIKNIKAEEVNLALQSLETGTGLM